MKDKIDPTVNSVNLCRTLLITREKKEEVFLNSGSAVCSWCGSRHYITPPILSE